MVIMIVRLLIIIIIIIGTFAGVLKETFRTHSSYCVSEMSPSAHLPVIIILIIILIIIIILVQKNQEKKTTKDSNVIQKFQK